MYYLLVIVSDGFRILTQIVVLMEDHIKTMRLPVPQSQRDRCRISNSLRPAVWYPEDAEHDVACLEKNI